MERIFKKYFWVINLFVIAILCYVLASTINEITARFIRGYAVKKAEKKVESFEIPSVSLKTQPPPNMVETLKARNVFNSEPEPEIPLEELEEEEEEISDEIIESDLDVQLFGTMVSKYPQWSYAIVNYQNNSNLTKIGAKIIDDAEVIQIKRRYIILLHNNKKKIVKLWGEGESRKPQRYGSMHPTYSPSPTISYPSEPVPPMDYSKGVKKTGPYDFFVDRTMLEESLQDLSHLGMQARIVPNYQNGKYEGFKLMGIRPNSLYRAIGIQSGDIIKRVNGEELNSPNKAIELFNKLKTTSSVTLDIERRGQNISLNYKIK